MDGYSELGSELRALHSNFEVRLEFRVEDRIQSKLHEKQRLVYGDNKKRNIINLPSSEYKSIE